MGPRLAVSDDQVIENLCFIAVLVKTKQTEEGKRVQYFHRCWQKYLLKLMFVIAEFSFCGGLC